MQEKINTKLNKGERLDQNELLFLALVNDYPSVRGLLSIDYLGTRAQRKVDYFFEVRRVAGRIKVQMAFELFHPRIKEIRSHLLEAVKQLHHSTTSAQAIRMKFTTSISEGSSDN